MKQLTLFAALLVAGCGGGSSNSGGNPQANAISVVQSMGMSAGCSQIGGCNSHSVIMPNPVANGDLVVVVIKWGDYNPNIAAAVTVTDSANNTYTSIAPTTNFSCGGSTLCYVFYAHNVAGGSNFTVQASLANTAGYTFDMTVLEAKGGTTFDTWTTAGCTPVSGCTAYASDPLQLTHADELLVGFANIFPQPGTTPPQFNIEAGPDFTKFYTASPFAVEYLVTTTPGQYTGVFMSSDLGQGAGIFAAFY